RNEERRAQQDLPAAGKVDLAVDEHRHEQRINDSDAGGFGRGEDAAVNSTQEDGGGADRPTRLLARLPDRTPTRAQAERNAFQFRIAHDVRSIDDTDQKTRQDSRG